MQNSILEKLVEKSHLESIKMVALDLTAQQDIMLENLTQGCYQKAYSQPDSVSNSKIREQLSTKPLPLPLALRKKKLYEDAIAKQATVGLKDDDKENVVLEDFFDKKVIPLTLRKRLLYEQARVG